LNKEDKLTVIEKIASFFLDLMFTLALNEQHLCWNKQKKAQLETPLRPKSQKLLSALKVKVAFRPVLMRDLKFRARYFCPTKAMWL
jgi:hypothetical protein